MLLESENKKSRHVLIAEGTGSRGESLVRAFTDRGATTAFFCRDRYKEALELSRETGALNIKCNVFNRNSMEFAADVVKEFMEDRLDTLVCNILPELNRERPAEDWSKDRESLMKNLDAVGFYLQTMLPLMGEGGSVIVLLQSGDSDRETSEPMSLAENMLQSALKGMIQSRARSLRDKRIRVNGLLLSNREEAEPKLGGTVRFLASRDADGITGQLIQM